MLTTAQIYEAIEKRRKELGLSQADVSARAFDRADSSALQSIRRGSMPSAQKLAALGRVLGLRFEFEPGYSTSESGAHGQSVSEPAGAHRPIPWHIEAWIADPVPLNFTPSFIAALETPVEHIRAVRPLTPEGETTDAFVALLDVSAARTGGPALWCFRETRRTHMARLQFTNEGIVVMGRSIDESVRCLPPGSETIGLLGRVVWFGARVGSLH